MGELAGDSSGGPLELELRAEPGSVPSARRAAARFAEAHGVDADAVATAVSEVVANAVIHAYREQPPGKIRVSGRPNGKYLLVTVQDEGIGIAPNPRAPGLGMGLSLAGSLSSGIEIESAPGEGTFLRMKFRLPRSHGPA